MCRKIAIKRWIETILKLGNFSTGNTKFEINIHKGAQ